MMRRCAVTIAVSVAVLLLCDASDARPIREWSYEELVAASDIVVICHAIRTESVDNSDRFLPEALVQQETTFRAEVVLKGELDDKSFRVIHFRAKTQRERDADNVDGNPLYGLVINGPWFVDFQSVRRSADGSEAIGTRYLLFLRRREQARFDPTSGHNQPGSSVRRLESEEQPAASIEQPVE
jgi:hypothetical protein